MKKLIIILSFVVVSFASLMIGSYYSSTHLSGEYDRAQANLTFGRIVALQEIESDLNKGCEQQALNRVSHAIDEGKMLIAEYIQATDDERLQEYISIRDSDLLEELKTYPVNWDKKWTIKGCDELK